MDLSSPSVRGGKGSIQKKASFKRSFKKKTHTEKFRKVKKNQRTQQLGPTDPTASGGDLSEAAAALAPLPADLPSEAHPQGERKGKNSFTIYGSSCKRLSMQEFMCCASVLLCSHIRHLAFLHCKGSHAEGRKAMRCVSFACFPCESWRCGAPTCPPSESSFDMWCR